MAAIACVLVSHFPYVVEAARDPALRGRRVLITRREGTRPVVLDCSPSAEVPPGTPLQTAHARYKDAVLLEADTSAYEEAWNAVLDSLEQRSPVVESAGLGCAYVGLTGLDALYGGSAKVASAVLNAVPPSYNPRVGVGTGKFPAEVAASFAGTGSARHVPDDMRGFLAPVSVDALPVSWEMRARLHEFGLHVLGEIANRPLGPIQAQFGPNGALAWHLARGEDDRPLIPRPHDAKVVERMEFDAPTASVGTLLLAADVLLGRAYRQPQLHGKAARTLSLVADVLGAGVWQRRLTGRESYADKGSALRAVQAVVDGLTLPGPLTGLGVELTGLVGTIGKQTSLFTDVRAQERLGEAVRQLTAQLGTPAPIYVYREMEPWSRIPERRGVLVRYSP